MVIQQAKPRGRTTSRGAERVRAKALETTVTTPKAAPPAGPRPVRLVPQIAVVTTAVSVYFLVRGATNSAATEAVHNARKIVSLERAVGIYQDRKSVV